MMAPWLTTTACCCPCSIASRNNFTFLANYTDSNCISDADFGAALAAPANSQPFNRHADWGPCVFDTRHNFNTISGGAPAP